MGLLRILIDSIVAQFSGKVNIVLKKSGKKQKNLYVNRELLIFQAGLVDFTSGLWYNIGSK